MAIYRAVNQVEAEVGEPATPRMLARHPNFLMVILHGDCPALQKLSVWKRNPEARATRV